MGMKHVHERKMRMLQYIHNIALKEQKQMKRYWLSKTNGKD
jgi:hypothetical protein